MAPEDASHGGFRRALISGVFLLGMIGGGVIGGLTTSLLTGGQPAVLSAGPQQPLVRALQTTAALVPESPATAAARQVMPSVVTVRTGDGAAPRNQAAGEGSGVIIDQSGLILTNDHVVAGADTINVILSNKTQVRATVVGKDPFTDLAVLKIDLPAGRVAVASLGDSAKLQIGDQVIAVGAPFGLDHSVTAGIVSAVNRSWVGGPGRRRQFMIQTDAPVNPGNSGGPLVNSAGEVIGITTALAGPIEGSVGIGFALPINRVKHLLPQLSTGQRIDHPWFGITSATITPDVQEELHLTVSEGQRVFQVYPDSPAARAGVKGGEAPLGGDIITKIDGQAMGSGEDLSAYLETKMTGDRITVTLLRDGDVREIAVTLGRWPENLTREPAPQR